MNIPPLGEPHPVCPSCRGVGRIVLLTSAVECVVCRGTGAVKASCLYAMHETDGVDRVNVSYEGDVIFTLAVGETVRVHKPSSVGRFGSGWSWSGIGYQGRGESPR
jgi:RecJ-like exonuclease